MAALVGNFLFVSNVGNQAALPSVLQEATGKDSEHMAVPFAPCGWPTSIVGPALSKGTPGKISRKLGQGCLEY